MYLFVFFDLPVVAQKERKAASRFRQFLLRDGYDMMQFSVYTRICRGQDAVEKHINRLKNNLPQEGSIRALQVTDKQYARMKRLLGKKKKHEKTGKEQMVLL